MKKKCKKHWKTIAIRGRGGKIKKICPTQERVSSGKKAKKKNTHESV